MTRNTLLCLTLAACSPGLADPAPPVGAEPAIVVCTDLPLEHEEEARPGEHAARVRHKRVLRVKTTPCRLLGCARR